MTVKCIGCGIDIQGSQKVYCSNACQQAYRRRALLDVWLETGASGRMSYRGHFVRDYLYAQQDGRCAICAIASHWNGASLALIIDHIDGNATNNRRENLRLICPNCDSQLPTFKAKNRGSGRHYRRQRYANGQSY
ncbi:HNH endonuclease [Mycobacterium sp. ENV421]|uniref:HNH endonuclease n=1 Tax=Mycobacterium sp. ENV421 TaxID=1213407 RepID=UPI000C9BBFAA|nr:HNH endonuclease [Mycobacterium sp. ENV421]PND57315.1 HNH endonuclease [Mycobacterium sp. ENV421]